MFAIFLFNLKLLFLSFFNFFIFFKISFKVGDKAAFEQQAQLTMEKNKEIIEHLKQQNSELRKRVIQIKRVCFNSFSSSFLRILLYC